MVLASGGENPQPELDPTKTSVGIRLTKRNQAIDQIQNLRSSVYRFETKKVIGNRKPTTAWTNCFGARHYQPHVKLLRPGSGIKRDIKALGQEFRAAIEKMELDRFQIRCGQV